MGVSEKPVERAAPLVVVADDDRASRDELVRRLREHGMEAEGYANGQKVIDRITAGGVDLVLLDVIMPGLSGFDCCRVIKTMTQASFLPVIMVTARADSDSRVEGLRIGADDYVCKPFDDRELMARVDGMLRIKHRHDEVQQARANLEQLAIEDELTGLYNYRYLHTRLAEEFKRSERYRDPLACAMVDIDHFKKVNDTHGHDVGDHVLAEVARRLRGAVREIDVVARYGGEEFLLVLPSTHFSGALTVADRVWHAVSEEPVPTPAGPQRITISLGVALFPSRDVHTKDELIKAADNALYQAKSEGRNRICVFQHQGYMYKPETARG